MPTPVSPTKVEVSLPLEPIPNYAEMVVTANAQVVAVQAAADYPNQPDVQVKTANVQTKATALGTTLSNITKTEALLAGYREQRPLDAIGLHQAHDEWETSLNAASANNKKAALAWTGKIQTRTPRTASTEAPESATFKNTATSGTGELKCKADAGALCYLYRTGADPTHPELWAAPVVDVSSHKVPGLAIGQKIYGQIAIQRRRGGQGAWSDVMELIAREPLSAVVADTNRKGASRPCGFVVSILRPPALLIDNRARDEHMPAFVIHTLGFPPRKVVVDSPPVRVGRDDSNEIVLRDETVSRQHAMFIADEKGSWHVSCVSDTNPIAVDGALLTTGTRVSEGTEVVIGTESMIVFSESSFSANAYMGGDKYFEKSTCARCGWCGMVSTLRKKPVCPRCAAEILPTVTHRPDNEQPGAGSHRLHGGRFAKATAQMNASEAKGAFDRINTAQHSRIERLDGKDADNPMAKLSIAKAIAVGNVDGAALSLRGLFVFGSLGVKWDGAQFVVTSAMKFPAMKVNGAKAETAALANGDVIEVGSNRFRFVVGKAGDGQ